MNILDNILDKVMLDSFVCILAVLMYFVFVSYTNNQMPTMFDNTTVDKQRMLNT